MTRDDPWRGSSMIAAFSVTAIVVGATVAYLAGRHSRHQRILQTAGGLLMIAGFALLGYSLEQVLGPPLP